MKKISKRAFIYTGILITLALCAYKASSVIDKPNDPVYQDRDTSVSPVEDFLPMLMARG